MVKWWNDNREYQHPGRLTWNLQITHLERNMIFQTSMIMFHVDLPGWEYQPTKKVCILPKTNTYSAKRTMKQKIEF